MGTKTTLPNNEVNITKSVSIFRRVWKSLDEDSKEIISSALYVLSRKPGDILQSHTDSVFALTPEKKILLNDLARISERE